ncbi:MAG: peptidylprolyl isomerase [Betaproteobacteria bacterium]|nr:peptidylprolyl isomerase [Betaproteobacteria bacterium]MBI2289193.1 peptidylprolyl isomerase [Betaproteobacteria bacterium]MBI3055775.1 peptidylprolyl isomerase [Betaproteobacteria bacterium]
MQVAQDTVVSLHYELVDSQGELIEKTDAPIEYLHGGYDGIFALVEQVLQGKSVGESCDVYLQPHDAFGEYDESLVRIEPLAKFPPKLEVGMRFEGEAESSGEALVYTVTDIAEEKVVVDGNHPLAGMALRFHCTVHSIRAATAEEMAHGHAHGAHDHHH